jgi:hypothetical protein
MIHFLSLNIRRIGDERPTKYYNKRKFFLFQFVFSRVTSLIENDILKHFQLA